jgi:tetratricopeptide (TPR) repeat protein
MASSNLLNERRQDPLPSEVTDNKEDIQLIWLDGNMDNSSDYILTQTMLLELNPAAQFYSNFDRCLDLIKSIKDEQIFLVVSGAFARRVLSQIHHQHTLVAVFIFCANRQHHEPLKHKFNKIVEIFTDQDSLLTSIREKMDIVEKQTLAFSLFDQKQKSLKDLSKESASFIINQMLIYVLRQMPQDKQSKIEMLSMCRNYYQNNKHELKKIEEFKKSYNREKAIEWYTKECFLYKLLNKALRREDIELLYTFRFFIIDLCACIEEEKKNLKDQGVLTLYRGTQIPKEELRKLKDNVGKIISTNGFLSTSRNMNVSLRFAHPNFVMAGFASVLFEIQADPLLKTVIFADIVDKSRIEGEEEVLFNLNALFKIHSATFDSTLQLWKVQLNATDKGAEKVGEHLTVSKRQMEEISPIIYFGALLMNELGQVDQAGKYFNMLLKSLPSDHPDIAAVYNNIGAVHHKKDELNLALKNYEIAYEIRRKRLTPNHPHIAGSLNNIGNIYQAKGNYDTATDYYQKSLKIFEINHPGNHLGKATTIENIGRVYSDKEDFDTALTYLSRALEMYRHLLPDQHGDIANCFAAIGYAHKKKGNLELALDYYQQQLKMEEQCLPFDHPDLSTHLDWIVDTYQQMGEKEKGLEFCREKLIDQKNRLGENHPRVACTLMIMASVYEDDDPNKALEYYEEALSILENFTPPDTQTTSRCLTCMTCLYSKYEMNTDALRCELKALDLARQTWSADHINIANNLRNIGISYKEMNNSSEAFRYFNESLSIYKLNYGPEHEKVKLVEEDIARLTNEESPSYTNEADKENVEEEPHLDPDPLPSNSTPSWIAIVPKPHANSGNNKNSSEVIKSKTCIIQ